MSWNQARFDRGYEAAARVIRDGGLDSARRFHADLDGARAVDEYEVGVRTRLEEEQVKAE